jgi:hypothetical protein
MSLKHGMLALLQRGPMHGYQPRTASEKTTGGTRPLNIGQVAGSERRLGSGGKAVRLVAALVVATVLLAGSIWGSDDDFPFGPFRMFAGVNAPNEPAPDPRVEGVDASGATIELNEHNAGLRRAEIEDNEDEYIADPGRLSLVADAYDARNPIAPPLVRATLIMRWHEIRHSAATGRWHDQPLAVWVRPA